jgi:hypothetical protein
MMRFASNSRVEAARKSAARTLPEVFNICHAVSNAAVKILVAWGSKKPALLRSGVIGIMALLGGSATGLSVTGASSLFVFADDEISICLFRPDGESLFPLGSMR